MNEVSRRNLIHTTTIAAAAATLPTVASASPAGGQPGPNDRRLQKLLAEWRRVRAEDDRLEAAIGDGTAADARDDQRDQLVGRLSEIRDRMAEIEPDTAAGVAAMRPVMEWELSISRDESDMILTAGNARLAWRIMRFAFR